jgi:hypothetical protein
MSTARPDRLERWALVEYLTIAFAGVYPLSIVFGGFAVIEPLDPLAFARLLTASIGSALLFYWILRPIIRDRTTRVQWLGTFLLSVGSYAIVVNTLILVGWKLSPTDPRVALGYVTAAVAMATCIVRPWRAQRRDLLPIVVTTMLLVGANSYRGVARWWADPPPSWIGAADSLAAAPTLAQNTSVGPARDIYYIVLDEMGRADTLRELYGLDLNPFIADLRSNGFYVPDRSQSNYPHTMLSFSSFLNLDYLDTIAAAAGRTNGSVAPLEYLIQHDALLRLAKQAGYEVIGMGSDVAVTKRLDEADVCYCAQYGLSMLEQAVLEETPLAAAPLDRFTYGGHRSKVLASLDALEAGRESSRRQFVFAHILAPHPPFTFTPDGGFHRPDRPFMFNDGNNFLGPREEYLRGYHDQAAFVVQRVARIVHAILSRPGPRPVIVIHGDHGPGSRLQGDSSEGTDMAERFDIFAAYYFPDGPEGLYDSITPVNAARALANRYLGTALPRLPDVSFFSTLGRPYEFIDVSQEAAGGVRPRYP